MRRFRRLPAALAFLATLALSLGLTGSSYAQWNHRYAKLSDFSHHGRHYFYVEGEAELIVPTGEYTVLAARGPLVPMVDASVRVEPARPFAHTSPIWIRSIGSTDPEARRRAASDLVRAIDESQQRARDAYGEVETPRMQSRFDRARAVLRELIAGAPE